MVNMHMLSSSSCKLVDGCVSATVHRYLAWSFVVLFLLVIAVAWLRRKPVPEQSSQAEQAAAYTLAQPVAENVKAKLQMAIGVITVFIVGWRLLYAPGDDPAQLIIKGIGVGLAAAAALELAYTLFTPGPDEALDPLMLALSATILLKLSSIEGAISLANAGAFLLLGVLLAVLFATRLMLAERAERKRPGIWWIPRQHGENTQSGTASNTEVISAK
jgi:heme A synthase